MFRHGDHHVNRSGLSCSSAPPTSTRPIVGVSVRLCFGGRTAHFRKFIHPVLKFQSLNHTIRLTQTRKQVSHAISICSGCYDRRIRKGRGRGFEAGPGDRGLPGAGVRPLPGARPGPRAGNRVREIEAHGVSSSLYTTLASKQTGGSRHPPSCGKHLRKRPRKRAAMRQSEPPGHGSLCRSGHKGIRERQVKSHWCNLVQNGVSLCHATC